jgi:hypothetical protein
MRSRHEGTRCYNSLVAFTVYMSCAVLTANYVCMFVYIFMEHNNKQEGAGKLQVVTVFDGTLTGFTARVRMSILLYKLVLNLYTGCMTAVSFYAKRFLIIIQQCNC